MKKEFLPYDRALKLKQLGYDEEGFGTYNVNGEVLPLMPYTVESKAILFQQAFRWFRENYNWTIDIKQVTKSNWSYTLNNFPKEITYYGELYETYEEAELACLTKLIEIVEEA